ncbi:MAG: 6-phosphofructokinase [Propionibacteriaceae bacterium]|jgi:6-phosphofructokinase 1|nr:6-phosphofructokinase [Propionibacteriaceae bacterium]
MRVGILTAGGDSPGLNAAIRGFGKAAIGAYGMEVIGFRDGFTGLAQGRVVDLPMAALSGILTVGGTILGTSRDKLHKMSIDAQVRDMTAQAVANVKANRLDAVVILGGAGTAKNAKLLMDAGVNVVMLPKTIDNDIVCTDTSFGFATAMGVATEAIDRLHSTAHSHHRVILAELMGHRVGWLTLGAGISGGADVILIPEIPYDVANVATTVHSRIERGSAFSVIAVAEGARDQQDSAEYAEAQALVRSAGSSAERRNAKAHLAAVESAQREHTFKLARELERATGLETRVSILGYVQRGGSPGATDRMLATRVGAAAAKLVSSGVFGVMTAVHGADVVPVPLSEVAGKTKTVPINHDWITTARMVGTGLGD